MGTLVVVYVASHVISQKSLQRKLLSTVGALKHLFPVGNVLPFAVVQKLHLAKKLSSWTSVEGFHPVGKEPSTSGATYKSLLGVAPAC